MANVIAIDGPSGSGKSSVAQKVAKDLGMTYIDTGAMFRALACGLSNTDIDFTQQTLTEEESKRAISALENLNFEYSRSSAELVVIDGVDLTQKIREHDISLAASHISRHPVIREYLANFQRELAKSKDVVMEGRDIGTVIFPNAKLKVFLTANNHERAKRRYLQLEEKGTLGDLTVERIEEDLTIRDKQDSSRASAPLVKADDAIEIDTSNMSFEEVVNKIQSLYQG